MPVCIEGLQVRYTSFAQHRERSSIGIWFVLLLLLSLLVKYIPGGSGRTYHTRPTYQKGYSEHTFARHETYLSDIYVRYVAVGLSMLFSSTT